MVIISLVKGGNSPQDSLLGIVKCGKDDWIMFAVLQVVCIIFLLISIHVIKTEYREKTKVGYTFTEGEMKATTKDLS